MALTRKLLKGMGLTDEQMDTIIEAHSDTVDGLKGELSKYKADAEKLPGVQKELEDLKAKGRTSTTKSRGNLTSTRKSRRKRKPEARRKPLIVTF